MQLGMTFFAVARLHGGSPSLLFHWRRLMSEGGRTAVRADEDLVVSSRVSWHSLDRCLPYGNYVLWQCKWS
jgi:transposase-like protein